MDIDTSEGYGLAFANKNEVEQILLMLDRASSSALDVILNWVTLSERMGDGQTPANGQTPTNASDLILFLKDYYCEYYQ